MQHEITQPGPLLTSTGSLAQVGWARQPLLEANLEQAAFYPPHLRAFQKFRVKRWDYYALFTPHRFYSATVADLGYAANVFVYALDFATNELHEEGKIVSSGAVSLTRGPEAGLTHYHSKDLNIEFRTDAATRRLLVDWPAFNKGRGIRFDVYLHTPPGGESMNIVIPIKSNRFYYNRKVNCLPAEGLVHYGEIRDELFPSQSFGSLDWGRGVWEYRSYWNWASASGCLPDGRTVGLNLGCGFGDTSKASENALILDHRIHKLDGVLFSYDKHDYEKPWRFRDDGGRLDLTFTPFKHRIARSNLLVITSEVHQMFGRYSGTVEADDGEVIKIENLVGFAEEHHAKW